MGNGIDAMLDKFGPRNVTAISTNGLLRVLPHADVLPPVASLSEVTALLLGGPNAQVTEQAARHVASDELRKAVWVTTGLDAGDGIVTVVSSLRSALALYLARKSGNTAPAAWATHQGGDAVLKAVGIGHLLDLCFPGSDDPVLELAGLPAGRALLAYFAAAEVALPFMEQLADGGHALERLIPEHLDAQVSKLSTVAGRSAVDAAQVHLDSITLTVDVLVSRAGEYIGPFVQSAEGAFPGAGSVVDTVGDVVAAGADVLPVYRFLGVRLVAEAAVVRAARELGVGVPDSGLDWIAAYVDAPRRALMAASAEAASVEAGEDVAIEDGPSGNDGDVSVSGPDGALSEPVGPAALAPEPVSSEAVGTSTTPASAETTAAAVGNGAEAVSAAPGHDLDALGVGAAAAAVSTAVAPSLQLDTDSAVGGGESVEDEPVHASPPVVAPAPSEAVNKPVPASPPVAAPAPAPSEDVNEAVPPPLPVAEPAHMPDPPETTAAVPPLPTATSAASESKAAPPPLPTTNPASTQKTGPSSSEPVVPAKEKTAPPPLPVRKPKLAPPTPRQPSPTPRAAAPKHVPAPVPKRVARVAPPPTPATMAPKPSPRDPSSTGEDMSQPAKSGVSIAAIGVAVALVALLGCAGLVGLGGVGALFMGAHEEATDEANPGAGKGTKKAGKGTKKAGKGTKKAGKGTKKAGKGSKQGKSKTKRTGGKRKGSGR